MPFDFEDDDTGLISGNSSDSGLMSDNKEEIEQSFGLETGRYRGDDGRFVDGSPPPDYNSRANRFQAKDGGFKNRSHDLGAGTEWDAPEDDAETSMFDGLFNDRYDY